VARLFISRYPSIHPVILLPSPSQSYAGRWRKGLQSLLLSQYVSFQIYCQLFQACLTPSSIWPNHLVLDHSTGFFLLILNPPYCYPCSTYSTRRKAFSRSSSNSTNKLKNSNSSENFIFTRSSTIFWCHVVYFGRQAQTPWSNVTHMQNTTVSFAIQKTYWAVRFQMLGLWI